MGFTDVNMFSTAFRNLVSNAIKFTSENGNISIHLIKMEDFCEITVKDSGVGIAAEDSFILHLQLGFHLFEN